MDISQLSLFSFLFKVKDAFQYLFKDAKVHFSWHIERTDPLDFDLCFEIKIKLIGLVDLNVIRELFETLFDFFLNSYKNNTS